MVKGAKLPIPFLGVILNNTQVMVKTRQNVTKEGRMLP